MNSDNRYVLIYLLKSSFQLFVSLSVVFLITFYILPEELKEPVKPSYVFMALFLISLLRGIKRYRTIKINSRKAEVAESTHFDTYPLASIRALMLDYEVRRDLSLKKVDIWKSLSPLPVLVYGMGLYLESKKMIEYQISYMGFSIEVKEIALYCGILLLLYYCFLLWSAYKDYEQYSFDYIRFKKEEIRYEEALLSLEKTRKVSTKKIHNN
ncbi:hypothetical protein C4A76_10540 [Brevibacillus laterosporus]|uniref:hypothetical protein n=1 Tax=Brevibacillus laterosporus TaxID=1465 RepID=UPI000CE41026|nr:hypothetical protein [Brevibacillus laterosporus]PPA87910.1 hypothetical protein C4A76_10540 [Brevibacillus laterosporus]